MRTQITKKAYNRIRISKLVSDQGNIVINIQGHEVIYVNNRELVINKGKEYFLMTQV